jgi:hypothetical protein
MNSCNLTDEIKAILEQDPKKLSVDFKKSNLFLKKQHAAEKLTKFYKEFDKI